MFPLPKMLLDIELVLGNMGLLAVLDANNWLPLLLVNNALLLERLLERMEVLLPIMELLLDMIELLLGMMVAGGRWVETRWCM